MTASSSTPKYSDRERQSVGENTTPNASDIRRLVKRKSDNVRRLNAITNRIKRLQVQEVSVGKDVTVSQRSSARKREAQYARQLKHFELLQKEQATLQERHGKRNSAIQQRSSMQEGLDGREKTTRTNRLWAVQGRFEAAERRKQLKDVADIELDAKRTQVAKVKNMKSQASAKVDEYKERRRKELSKESEVQFCTLQKQLEVIEAEIRLAEVQEMETIDRLQRSHNWKRQSLSDYFPPDRVLRNSAENPQGDGPTTPARSMLQTEKTMSASSLKTSPDKLSAAEKFRSVENPRNSALKRSSDSWSPTASGQLGQISEEVPVVYSN